MQILIPDSWLRKYLETNAKPRDIQKALSLCGPSVERLHEVNKDHIYDVEVTTNRVDCMSIYGIAREAAAILPHFGFTAKLLSDPFTSKLSFKTSEEVDYLTVKVDPELCQNFSAILISGVKVGPSPKDIVTKLEAVGMRSLNNVIDISNILMHELGQPVHTFDYDKIAKHSMILRESRVGESLTTLDGKSHKLPGHDIVIEDGSKKLIDLCGIMGGASSSIDDKTKNVLLFVQTYDPTHIRKTSMTLAHRTSAAVLFEKALSTESVLPTLEHGVQLFKQLTGGTPSPLAISIQTPQVPAATVTASPEFVTSRLGIDISVSEIKTILSSLGFTHKIPWWRKYDVSIPEDLVEEVARIYGYHNLPSVLMTGALPTTRPNEHEFYWVSKIKSYLKHIGFTETYTYSLTSQDSGLKLKNPLSSDWVYLRTKLSHDQVIAENSGRVHELNLFEVANVYIPQKNALPTEELHLLLSSTHMDYTHFKGVLDSLFAELGVITKFTITKTSLALTCDLDLTSIIPHATSLKRFTPISKFAPIIEDFNMTLVGDYDQFVKSIYKISPLIQSINFIDKYQDRLTLRITFLDPNKQLTKDDIAPLRDKLQQKY